MVDVSAQHFHNRVQNGAQPGPETRFWLAALALIVLLILAVSWNSIQILSIKYEIEELAQKNHDLERECVALKALYESEKSPVKIASLGRQMGLVNASESDITILQGEPFVPVERNLVAENRSSRSIHE